MDEDTLTDLKQFITTSLSQQTVGLKESIVSEVRKDLARLEIKIGAKIDNLSLSVAQAIDNTNETTDRELKNVDRRVTRLEQAATS